MKDQEFEVWKRNQNKDTLFFDGVVKGNPRVTGVGGVLFDTRGNIVE